MSKKINEFVFKDNFGDLIGDAVKIANSETTGFYKTFIIVVWEENEINGNFELYLENNNIGINSDNFESIGIKIITSNSGEKIKSRIIDPEEFGIDIGIYFTDRVNEFTQQLNMLGINATHSIFKFSDNSRIIKFYYDMKENHKKKKYEKIDNPISKKLVELVKKANTTKDDNAETYFMFSDKDEIFIKYFEDNNIGFRLTDDMLKKLKDDYYYSSYEENDYVVSSEDLGIIRDRYYNERNRAFIGYFENIYDTRYEMTTITEDYHYEITEWYKWNTGK